MPKVAAVFVLYNPSEEFIYNLNSVRKQVDWVYIIDNSENVNESVIRKIKLLENIEYLFNKSNIGIAAAINKAAELAIENNFEFILTMDQDSFIEENYINKMLQILSVKGKIGLLAPLVVHILNPKEPTTRSLERITVAMTSGCLVRLSAYKFINGFLEKLFIDYVDNEFCLRLKKSGYEVYRLNSVKLYHNLGDIKPKKILFWKVFPTYHSPLRLYYRTRNRLFVYKNYKSIYAKYILQDFILFIKEYIKILLFEDRKYEKTKMIIRGFTDYRKNKFGKFE